MTSFDLPVHENSENSTWRAENILLYHGDCRVVLPSLEANSVDMVLTSPPYWHKIDYLLGPGQMGLEPTPTDYLARLSPVLQELLRVTKPGGSFLLNIGDTYNNYSPLLAEGGDRKEADFSRQSTRRKLQPGYIEKEPIGIPEMVKQAARAAGWLHRANLIWVKGHSADIPNSDRPSCIHEDVFYFLKPTDGRRTMAQYFNSEAVPSSVLQCAPTQTKGHRCPFPVALARQLVEGFCPPGGVVLDPFAGHGGIPKGAIDAGRCAIGIEMQGDNFAQAVARCQVGQPEIVAV